MRTQTLATLATSLLLALTFAGCHEETPGGAPEGDATSYQEMGFDGEHWPDLSGRTVTILDHGAFGAFDSAKAAFEELTGATVEHIEADDTGSALNRAMLEAGDPSFDVLYGVDNILWQTAVDADVFEPYTPLLADRIDDSYVFFDGDGDWPATPVDHGYIGLNVDAGHASLEGAEVSGLDDVAMHADTFVTQDPRTSTPGLGFLVATVATYGEEGDRTWQDYWTELFEGGVLVTAGWSEAYMNHFTAAGDWVGDSNRDKAIVTSYTESPAYEAFFGMPEEDLAEPIVVADSTFHQIQTMGIVRGTDDRIAAEAWIEFTLTDAFQTLAAPENAVYPVTTTDAAQASVDETYGGLDPAPGSFEPVDFDAATLGANVERWVAEWVSLCEEHDCA